MSIFSEIKSPKLRRNKFKMSYSNKMSCKPGILYPFYLEHMYPNDTAYLRNSVLCRLAPMQAPIMQNIDIYTHYFFVPYRLIWSNWKKFITQGETGKLTVPYPTIDNIDSGYFQHGQLADFLRFPTLDKDKEPAGSVVRDIDTLPFRAYQLIWNEYYRDQNVDDAIAIGRDYDNLTSGQDITDDYETGEVNNDVEDIFELRSRAWKKDYFTSALPFAQRGEEVELPLVGDASLKVVNPSTITAVGQEFDKIQTTSPQDSYLGIDNNSYLSQGGVNGSSGFNSVGNVSLKSTILPQVIANRLGVDMSNVSSATINELRRAIKAQEFLEARARGGSRYIEQMLSIFGVRSSDARLQRPEFLGGGKAPIVISDVLQTSQSTTESPLATPSGHGVGVERMNSPIKYFCEEHGFIIGLLSIVPKAGYFQGMPRQYMFRDPLDFYWPQFAHLGEQEIKLGELYYNFDKKPDDKATNGKLFGYTPRYAEMKFRMDEVHGDFRENLKFWHMARDFAQAPALNSQFLHDFSAFNRVFSVTKNNWDKLWLQVDNNVILKRAMPKFGTPRI